MVLPDETFSEDASIVFGFFGNLVGAYSFVTHLPVRELNVCVTKKNKRGGASHAS